jgi:hypothetical protein
MTTSYILNRNRRDIAGPTGPTGYSDKYLSITQQFITYESLIYDYLLIITVESYLSYISGDTISVISIDKNEYNQYQGFDGEVYSYNATTGELIINNIKNITQNFFNDTFNYKINFNNVGKTGCTGPTGDKGDKYINI